MTVDTPVIGRRLADRRNYFSLPPHLRVANFPKEMRIKSAAERINLRSTEPATEEEAADSLNTSDTSLQWTDIAWFKSVTKMKIIVKGVITREDAEMACKVGVDAIWVSNHGGRQLDGTTSTIDALPEVIEAVGDRPCEVYMDGGVRTGTDVLKALALGARAVFLGRPMVWALAHGGEEGAKGMLSIMFDEFRLAMVLTGCRSVKEITRDRVVHETALALRLARL